MVCGEDSQHKVGIHNVVERLEEDGQEPKAGHDAREGGDDPMYVLAVAGPPEPENADCKRDTTEDDGR